MSRKILRLAAQYALLLLLVVTVNFFIVYLVPGDPADAIARGRVEVGGEGLSQADRDLIHRYYGLDQPLARQYFNYMAQLARGDLGYSFFFHRPAAGIVFEYGWRTLAMVLAGMVLAIAVGLPLGMLSASRRGSRLDSALLMGQLVLHSVPPFFIAIILLIVFAVELQWLPFSGSGAAFAGTLRHLALPALSLAIWECTTIYYFTRNALVDVLSQEYILVAYAKGLSPRAVMLRHALPAVLPALVARFALLFGTIAGGVFFAEQVFSYPGVALLALTAFENYDYLLLRGVFLWMAVGILAANFAADICMYHLDPRAREA